MQGPHTHIHSIASHIRCLREGQKRESQLKKAFDDAAADCFYDKSVSEYKIIRENFREVSKCLGRLDVLPCHSYMLKNHIQRNKVFNDMCTPKRRSTLTPEDLKHPSVTVDIAKYMGYVMGYKNAKLCIDDRSGS